MGKKIKITVEVEQVKNTEKLFFHTELASGTFGPHDFKVCQIANGSGMYLQTGEKKYILSVSDFANAVLNEHYKDETDDQN